MKTFQIAAIPGDGIGKEVLPAGIRVLKVVEECEGTFGINFEILPWGCDYYHAHGRMMAEDGLDIRNRQPHRSLLDGRVDAGASGRRQCRIQSDEGP